MVLEGEIEGQNLTLLLVEGKDVADDYADYDPATFFLDPNATDAANASADLSGGGEMDMDCSACLNELCLSEEDYAMYKSWVGVDTYEMVLICINAIVFLTGIVGNSLVREQIDVTVCVFACRSGTLIILSSNVQLF